MRALEFENISKLYTLGKIGTGTLSRDLTRWWQTSVLKHEDPYLKIGEANRRFNNGGDDLFWALRDISFNVDKGDVVGIIGKNGSGKSTLLKILSKITAPTKGEIRVKGKVASLLEVGTGFHPDLTGRENIYMNGTILGMTKGEISRKIDEIVAFSGVEDHIDTPVKRYSSGMKVRLGFAVAAHLEPDILIVDEVLAVGDADFQKKAIGKMQSVSTEEGRTVLFVSHNMNSVTQLCNRGVVLDGGRLIFDGNVHEAVNRYLGENSFLSSFEGIDGDENVLSLKAARVYQQDCFGPLFNLSKPLHIEMEVNIAAKLSALIIGFNIYSQYGSPLARADFNDRNLVTTLDPGLYRFSFTIPAYTLANGNYKIVFDVAERNGKKYSTKESDLYFEMVNEPGGFGSLYSNTKHNKNSIIRADWLDEITDF